ncbi:MAG TPA: inositol monophosphatase family protein [Ferrovibrio sp.]|uniref:inositol monophosphatase family protein n=1 Tax=Ferrovibrio sp. TaxID=1917215 RepID=UPI002B4B87E0|nr:inositol monophosphatase family protein [Ferrovibrio sp.]HLT76987.1 inositol monophosphatase family protein [Ferrovibrio sp.]
MRIWSILFAAMIDIEQRLNHAEQVIREAGKLARGFFDNRNDLVIKLKGVQDFVSQADAETEDLIASRLLASFPHDGILGEERGRRGGETDAVWVIDPIDGTANFVRGLPYWCVAIALVCSGRIELGLIFDPVSNKLYSARRGHGAFCNGQPIAVSGATRLEQACIGLGLGHGEAGEPHAALIERLLRAHCQYRRLGSGLMLMALTAEGAMDGFYEARMKPWDALAGLLLVREAGGMTNDYLGFDGEVRAEPVLAITPGLWNGFCQATGVSLPVFSEAQNGFHSAARAGIA